MTLFSTITFRIKVAQVVSIEFDHVYILIF